MSRQRSSPRSGSTTANTRPRRSRWRPWWPDLLGADAPKIVIGSCTTTPGRCRCRWPRRATPSSSPRCSARRRGARRSTACCRRCSRWPGIERTRRRQGGPGERAADPDRVRRARAAAQGASACARRAGRHGRRRTSCSGGQRAAERAGISVGGRRPARRSSRSSRSRRRSPRSPYPRRPTAEAKQRRCRRSGGLVRRHGLPQRGARRDAGAHRLRPRAAAARRGPGARLLVAPARRVGDRDRVRTAHDARRRARRGAWLRSAPTASSRICGPAGRGVDGWIHAPSTRHAVAAGMLRSSHLSHLPAAGPADGGPFAIDLSSRRVQSARTVIDGVRQGQQLGALVGYQIERGLAEARLARLQLSLRTIAPLVARRLHDEDETTRRPPRRRSPPPTWSTAAAAQAAPARRPDPEDASSTSRRRTPTSTRRLGAAHRPRVDDRHPASCARPPTPSTRSPTSCSASRSCSSPTATRSGPPRRWTPCRPARARATRSTCSRRTTAASGSRIGSSRVVGPMTPPPRGTAAAARPGRAAARGVGGGAPRRPGRHRRCRRRAPDHARRGGLAALDLVYATDLAALERSLRASFPISATPRSLSCATRLAGRPARVGQVMALASGAAADRSRRSTDPTPRPRPAGRASGAGPRGGAARVERPRDEPRGVAHGTVAAWRVRCLRFPTTASSMTTRQRRHR